MPCSTQFMLGDGGAWRKWGVGQAGMGKCRCLAMWCKGGMQIVWCGAVRALPRGTKSCRAYAWNISG